MKEGIVVGLISGSSLDGLDMAATSFVNDELGNLKEWKLIVGETQAFDEKMLSRLASATKLSGYELWQLHTDFGHAVGRATANFIKSNQLDPLFIASHGHAVFHSPETKMTCQIGDGSAIAAQTNLPVINDFRSLDIALGGQGAPIAPLADRLLFQEYNYFLNLGGIANLSSSDLENPMAYDICACNQLLNYYANKNGLKYDDAGLLARSGSLLPDVMEYLNAWTYYKKSYPKSLDNSEVQQLIHELDQRFSYSVKDMLHTSVSHMARKIALSFLEPAIGSGEIMAAGGGTFNTFLIEKINQNLSTPYSVIVPSDDIINYKEAVLFSLAGWRRWWEQPIFYKSLTGASRSATGGAIYFP